MERNIVLGYVVESYKRNTAQQKRKRISRRSDDLLRRAAFKKGIDPGLSHVIQRRA